MFLISDPIVPGQASTPRPYLLLSGRNPSFSSTPSRSISDSSRSSTSPLCTAPVRLLPVLDAMYCRSRVPASSPAGHVRLLPAAPPASRRLALQHLRPVPATRRPGRPRVSCSSAPSAPTVSVSYAMRVNHPASAGQRASTRVRSTSPGSFSCQRCLSASAAPRPCISDAFVHVQVPALDAVKNCASPPFTRSKQHPSAGSHPSAFGASSLSGEKRPRPPAASAPSQRPLTPLVSCSV